MSKRAKWTLVVFSVLLHPLLLVLLFPYMGETINLAVLIAPVTATLLFGWRTGLLFVPVNVIATAVIFSQVFHLDATTGRPKAVVSAFVLAVFCLAADRLRHFIIQRRLMAEELDRAKKMEAIGRLAGGVAHDMNNTLNAIMGSIFAHRQELTVYGRSFPDLDNIAAACDRGAQLTQNLLGFARQSNLNNQIFSLNRVIAGTELLLKRTAEKNIQIVTSLSPTEPYMAGDRSQIENAVMNLCLNALDAMGGQGTLTMKTGIHRKDVFLQISDTGEGMDRSVQEHVFEPFFTTKAEGKGTGLGLSMVYGAVHAMNGKIRLESAPGRGTDITLTFPRQASDVPEKSNSSVPPEPISEIGTLAEHTVLLVDDEPLVLRAGMRMLKVLGCRVVGAGGGKEALELFEKHKSEISLVVIDLIMPEMDGIATLNEIHNIVEDMPVILVSGYTKESDKLDILKQKPEQVKFLAKPYRPEQLNRIAQKLLDGRTNDSRVSSA
ncbi:MAG: response regulator [Deltaproteobacteria bacterium]|nr:response regulator [Deltaproteobacteria bacterium]MBN2674308.1 response regulator [Deltaproteobacteria bacterium]